MAAPIALREDFDGPGLRGVAKGTKDAAQARRLLALAEIYDGGSRTDAARIGGVTLQIVRDWVLRFNKPVAVEAVDPGGDRLVMPSSAPVSGRRVARPISKGQQGAGTLDLCGGSAGRAAQAGQLLALIRREQAQGIVLVARHTTPRSTRIASP